MKIIHQGGYASDELALYRLTIYKNVIDCAKSLIAAMNQFDVAPELPGNAQHCALLAEYDADPDPSTSLDPRVGEAIMSVWKDPCIAKVMEHSSEFYLMDSAP